MEEITDDKILKELFKIIYDRLYKIQDSLSGIKNIINEGNISHHIGIEAWVKVEAIKAIDDDQKFKIEGIKNRGVDLELKYQDKSINVELKGMTDFNWSVIYKGAKQDGATCCLFLVKWNDKRWKRLLSKNDIRRVDHNFISKESEYWLLGMIRKV